MSALKRLGIGVVMSVLTACGPGVWGNGKAGSVTHEVALFTEASFGSALEAVITEGELSSVVITGDDNILPLIEVVVTGNRLRAQLKPGLSATSVLPLHLTVTVPRLEYVEGTGASRVTAPKVTGPTTATVQASGASNVTVKSLDAPKVVVEASGASTVTVPEVRGDSGTFGASGSSQMTVGGALTQSDISAAGASTVEANELVNSTVAVTASGGSHVKAFASQGASGTASGASSVIVTGNPTSRTLTASGASNVTYP